MSLSIVLHEFGGPEKLLAEETALAPPAAGEIQVRHGAIGLNFIDTYHRSGLYKIDLPAIVGMEAAGEVIALGEGVTDFAAGDRVVYSNPMGAYCEARNMPADNAVKLPDTVDDRTAAALFLKGMTAYFLLHLTYPLKPGETTLIPAAAGGVGLVLTQWAKALGATVIGCAGTDEKCELARANGCDKVINYTEADFRVGVQEFTGGEGVDVVYDGVGKATFEASLDCLKPRGMMVSFGNATGVVSIPDLTILAARGSLYVCRPTANAYVRSRADRLAHAEALFEVIAAGKLKPTIGQTFALQDAAEAHRALEARRTVGSTPLLP